MVCTANVWVSGEIRNKRAERDQRNSEWALMTPANTCYFYSYKERAAKETTRVCEQGLSRRQRGGRVWRSTFANVLCTILVKGGEEKGHPPVTRKLQSASAHRWNKHQAGSSSTLRALALPPASNGLASCRKEAVCSLANLTLFSSKSPRRQWRRSRSMVHAACRKEGEQPRG
jgi:hypothetical protein